MGSGSVGIFGSLFQKLFLFVGKKMIALLIDLVQNFIYPLFWVLGPTFIGDDRKIAGNKGDLAPPADPCPWEGDWECDEEDDLCAPGTDKSDCQGGA